MGYRLRGYAASSLPALIVSGPSTMNGSLSMGSGTQVLVDPGAVGTPGLAFTTATTSGLYILASNTPAIAAAGVYQAYLQNGSGLVASSFTSSGTATFSSKVVNTPPTAQSITGVGVAITPTARIHEFTSDGDYTLTVAPTIANGTDGQVCILVNVGSNTVTIQDQGTLANSNLRLTGASVAIGPRDSVIIYYSGDVADWVQIGSLVGVV